MQIRIPVVPKKFKKGFSIFLVKWVYHKLYIFQIQIFDTNWPSLLSMYSVLYNKHTYFFCNWLSFLCCCMFAFESVYLSLRLSDSVADCLTLWLTVFLSGSVAACLSVLLTLRLTVCLSDSVADCLSVCLTLRLTVCLPVCVADCLTF